MTFYGDLDVSVIDELPPGRKPIKTMHKYDASRLLIGRIKEACSKGSQVYWVCALIEESELMNANPVEETYEQII